MTGCQCPTCRAVGDQPNLQHTAICRNPGCRVITFRCTTDHSTDELVQFVLGDRNGGGGVGRTYSGP